MIRKKFRIGELFYEPIKGEIKLPSIDEIIISWKNSFSFIKEDRASNIEGLRSPQIGAIHAALAHWEVSNESATIVMPTGTGKTETMLSLMIIRKITRLLIIVPNDSLRLQISKKFISLGLLRTLNLINEDALSPVVGVLKHRPSDNEETINFFSSCNVIVTTMNILGNLSMEITSTIAEMCSDLFIDEAHHIAATTWKSTKDIFRDCRILQFTATPFRNDSKPIKDKIIFNYPLRKAQEEGYFRKIRFIPLEEWDPDMHDEVIALKAIQTLREDLANGFNHVLMARVNSIIRAEEIFKFYNKEQDLQAILINSKVANKENIIKEIKELTYHIIICVDMLGEGFDLPQLKIAAFHDIKQSMPVTIQLTGRFTRDSRDEQLGDASIIVNLAKTEARDELEQLYAQDSDWNKLLPLISQNCIQEQISLNEFIKGFNKFPDELQLQNIRPALSTVIFRTNIEGEWFPSNFRKGIPGIEECEQIYSDINSAERVLIIVTGRKSNIRWGKINDLFELNWSLYIVYWNQHDQLLYINSSDNGGEYLKLAKAVTFDSAELINSEEVFKSLHGIAQMKINNVGLKNQLDKLLSFTMFTGGDIQPALSSSQLANRIKSNIFCTGYEDENKVSVGCSYKGRIWSKRTANLEEFIVWCNQIGTKILNPQINIGNILSEAIFLKTISVRPPLYPISISWNESLLLNENMDNAYLSNGRIEMPIYQFDLTLKNSSDEGNIRFEIVSERITSEYELQLLTINNREIFRFTCISNPLSLKIGTQDINLSDYFFKQSPIIRFSNGSYLEGNLFAEYKYKGPPFDKNRIDVIDWNGIDISKESQGANKNPDSIQFHIIQRLKAEDYQIIFDDDNAGEIADIIAVKTNEISKEINIELYHLKYSHGGTPGSRINDLYEVCGQAQKSIIWKGKGTSNMFKRMIYRAHNSAKNRIEVGSIKEIGLLKEKSRKAYKSKFKIFIVQPGLSRNNASEQQLELLAVTENHLMETYRIQFGVIGSD